MIRILSVTKSGKLQYNFFFEQNILKGLKSFSSTNRIETE